jgi:hypothetical protein
MVARAPTSSTSAENRPAPGAESVGGRGVSPDPAGRRRARPQVRVSVDTMKAEVARAAVGEGATLLNDVDSSLAALAPSSASESY